MAARAGGCVACGQRILSINAVWNAHSQVLAMTGNDPKSKQREVLTKCAFRYDGVCRVRFGSPTGGLSKNGNAQPVRYYRVRRVP